MLVTNENIEKDIAENIMVHHDAIKTDVVQDMMLYMRDIYESKLSSLVVENQILDAALRAVNQDKEEEPVNQDKEEEPVNQDKEEEPVDTLDDTIKLSGEMSNEIVDNLLENIMKEFADFGVEIEEENKAEEKSEFPDNYIFCEGSNESGEQCDGKDSCKKYLGSLNEDFANLVRTSCNVTNFDLCKSLNYDFFEAK